MNQQMSEDELNRMMQQANDGQLCITLPLADFRKLESDSQMLDDLIEMMRQDNRYFHITDIGTLESFIVMAEEDNNGQFTVDDLSKGATSRKAIAAAIKEWKKSQDKPVDISNWCNPEY
jgi:hypothetical protein